MTGTWEIREGDVLDRLREMPDESVHCVVTSPPYFGLRDYGTAEWDGGDAACDHKRPTPKKPSTAATPQAGYTVGFRHGAGDTDHANEPAYRDICGKCGARRIDRQLGLEPTPQAYLVRMVEVFREVRRVLRRDGTCWVNMGDSYNTGTSTPSKPSKGTDVGYWQEADNIGRSRVDVADLKPKDLIGMPWRLAFALQADGWWLRSEIIWCLSSSTVLYARTANTEGPMTIHDLVRLDPSTVQLWNGERWTQVRGWSSRQSETLRLTLRSGERIIASPNHRWPLADERIVATSDLVLGDVLATTLLPAPDEPTDEGISTDLAWFAGLYLAEGSRSDDAIQIAGNVHEVERHERTATIARRYGGSAVLHAGPGDAVTVVVHGAFLDAAIKHFVAGRTALDKHVHPRAWRSSNATLRAFVDGYLSGDGHHDTPNNRWRLGFGNNPQLVASLRTLAARLGATMTLKPTLARMGRALTFEAYRGEWRWDASTHLNAKHRSEVIAIEPRAASEVWDIGVEDEPHLFALASGVLTHNSKPNPMPESVTDRPTKAHEQIFLLAKSARYFYDADAVREQGAEPDRQRYDRIGGANGHTVRHSEGAMIGASATRNARSVWTIATQAFPEAHFATFPEELPRRCILAGTSERGVCPDCGAPWARVLERENIERSAVEFSGKHASADPRSSGRRVLGSVKAARDAGGDHDNPFPQPRTIGWEPTCTHDCAPVPALVLDPFAGSGTTVMVALQLGRSGIGIELSPEYSAMARRRIVADAPLLNAYAAAGG